MPLRDYQQAAFDAAITWVKKSTEPCLLELATGAGKSHICAAIAQWINEKTKKHVLCLAPSKELVEQNHEKYLATGNPASIFSASAGHKCTRYPVVFGTPQTVKNNISRFGNKFGAVVIDEAHGITPSIQFIIEKMKEANPRLRVIGMTATPYRTGTGYIYQYDLDGSFVGEDDAIDPYFNTLVYRVTAKELIERGFLTPPNVDPDHVDSYDTSGLALNSRGKFEAADVERAFEGKGRKTAAIVADVVAHSAGRMGVMLFAATVQHAKEILESLPPDNSRMIGGTINTNKADREKLIEDFKAQRFKYLVSVGTLTTGFDAPHVDVIAILRKTESPGLLQQIIGRGLRLHALKGDVLVLDYAENIEFHGLQDDLFKPQIRTKKKGEGNGEINAECPDCGFINEFSVRPNDDNLAIDGNGYFLDLGGMRIDTPNGPMPAHFGRRCCGQEMLPMTGAAQRCEYRWSHKECEECGHKNDIAARYCEKCKAEIVDPNEKLREEFQRIKKDPYSVSTDRVLEWSAAESISRAGNKTLLCNYKTEYRKFTVWYSPDSKSQQAQSAWRSLNEAVFSGHVAPDIETFMRYLHKGKAPQTITCAREKGTKFFTVLAHNQPEDERPEE